MMYIFIVFFGFFALRLVSLSFSIHNEKRLKKAGAVQYGKTNSLLLTFAHIAYITLAHSMRFTARGRHSMSFLGQVWRYSSLRTVSSFTLCTN